MGDSDGPVTMGAGEVALTAHAQSFRMLEGETLAGLLADYEQVVRRTDELVKDLPDLDALQPLPAAPGSSRGPVVRRAACHSR